MKYFAFNVRNENLKKAFEVLQKSDDMRGWQIQDVKPTEDPLRSVILVTREFDYPWAETDVYNKLYTL